MRISTQIEKSYLALGQELKRRDLKGLLNLVLLGISTKLMTPRCLGQLYQIQIESTTRCNLRCKMCPRSYWEAKNEDLSFDNFKRIVNQLPNLRSISFTGMGEPLLNRDIFKMIQWAKSKKIYTCFNDNASLIIPEIATKIIESSLDELLISIDAATEKTYEELRKGANFNDSIDNIIQLLETKKRLKSDIPRVSFVTVLMDENIEELPAIVKLAGRLGIKKIEVIGLVNFKKQLVHSVETMENEKVVSSYQAAKKLSKQLNINLRLPQTASSIGNCRYPWTTAYITYDGVVLPCCILLEQGNSRDEIMKNYGLGNMLTTNFSKIWNNHNYENFRSKLTSKNPLTFCKQCPVYKGLL